MARVLTPGFVFLVLLCAAFLYTAHLVYTHLQDNRETLAYERCIEQNAGPRMVQADLRDVIATCNTRYGRNFGSGRFGSEGGETITLAMTDRPDWSR